MNPAHLTSTELAVWTATFGAEYARAFNSHVLMSGADRGRTNPEATELARQSAETVAEHAVLAFRNLEREARM